MLSWTVAVVQFTSLAICVGPPVAALSLAALAAKFQPDFFHDGPWSQRRGASVEADDESALLGVKTWRLSSVNASLTCESPGCNATSRLVAYDPKTHSAKNCRLRLDLHPTDFDDQYSGERLEWVRVNGVTVSQDCFPMATGCNATTQRPTFPCLRNVLLDAASDGSGEFEVSAKISAEVDECPYKGNLLAAVPRVTCLVTPHTPRRNKTSALPAKPKPLSPRPPPPPLPTSVFQRRNLRCFARNCTAKTWLAPLRNGTLELHGSPARTEQLMPGPYKLSKCVLDVKLYQTDFDQDEGTVEVVEFLKLGKTTAKTDIAPGRNPCKAQWKGKPLSEEEMSFSVVESRDVTKELDEDGSLFVQAKISDMVDECSHDGYLLDAVVSLNCSLTNATQSGSNESVGVLSM